MKDQLERLIRLQKIETRYYQLERESGSIPEQIEDARKILEKVQEEHKGIKSILEAANQKRREEERNLEICEGKLTKARERQSEIKSNKEYQTHLHEIEGLMAEKGKIEEELLKLMEEVDTCKAREEEGLGKVKAAEGEFKKSQSVLEERNKALKHNLAQVDQERKTLSSEVEGAVFKRYNRLMSRQKGEVVVPIKNGSCGGCFMNVPPQLIAEVKTGVEIHTCSECRRILYWPEPSSESEGVNPTP